MSQTPPIPMTPPRRSARERHTQVLLTRRQVNEIAEEMGVPERLVKKLLRQDGVRKYYEGRQYPLYLRARVLELFTV